MGLFVSPAHKVSAKEIKQSQIGKAPQAASGGVPAEC